MTGVLGLDRGGSFLSTFIVPGSFLFLKERACCRDTGTNGGAPRQAISTNEGPPACPTHTVHTANGRTVNMKSGSNGPALTRVGMIRNGPGLSLLVNSLATLQQSWTGSPAAREPRKTAAAQTKATGKLPSTGPLEQNTIIASGIFNTIPQSRSQEKPVGVGDGDGDGEADDGSGDADADADADGNHPGADMASTVEPCLPCTLRRYHQPGVNLGSS